MCDAFSRPHGGEAVSRPLIIGVGNPMRADDGVGVIARVRELAGVDSNAVVSIALPGVTGAARCDLVERDLGPLPIKDGKVTIPVKANSLATVRFK